MIQKTFSPSVNPVLGFIAAVCLLSACQQTIKNSHVKIEDEVVDSSGTNPVLSPSVTAKGNSNLQVREEADVLGYWVGDFRNAEEDFETYASKIVAMDEGLTWDRANKINISIDKLEHGQVYGHSVVAGNFRPFEGTYQLDGETYVFEAKEPGDDRHDGTFKFSIAIGDTLLSGTWKAFRKIDIRERAYDLQKKVYVYNPDQMLVVSHRFADWDRFRKVNYENLNEEEKEVFGDFYLEFESATDLIFKINASNTLLTKQDVENLKRGDLYIIRNTIYARHGYSFRNRPLRVFFDREPWYIPVHNDIKKDLTDMEKENIKLLMKYEKNAKTYYDTFGRG